jgi:hypothetical protein
VLEAVFILLEPLSPSRRIFIGSHSLPPSGSPFRSIKHHDPHHRAVDPAFEPWLAEPCELVNLLVAHTAPPRDTLPIVCWPSRHVGRFAGAAALLKVRVLICCSLCHSYVSMCAIELWFVAGSHKPVHTTDGPDPCSP